MSSPRLTSEPNTEVDEPVSRRSVLGWWAGSVLALLAVVGGRVATTPRYFYWDDTQLGAFGQWYDLGRRLLEGRWTMLDPGAWQGGNFLAEQQWGLWNPVIWLVALGSHVQDDAALYATFVKIAFLVLLLTVTFGLARSYGASVPWSAFAGLSAGLGGQTMYLDAPSWVTGLQGLSLFVLTWWMLRRHLTEGRSPVPFFIAAFLLVTQGYIFAVIELVFLFVAVLVEAAVDRSDRRRFAQILGLGVYSGLLTIFTYLPGILTAPVTVRSGGGIANDQFLNLDLGDLATSPVVTGLSSVQGYWGPIAPAPIQYLGWFLPLLVVLVPRMRPHWRGLLPLLVLGGLTLAMITGPSVVGPLRYPARMLPYLVVCLAVLFAVAATKAWPRTVGRREVVLVLGTTGLAIWLAWVAQPDNMRYLALGAALQLAALALVLLVGRRVASRRAVAWAAAVAIVATPVLLQTQVKLLGNAPLSDFGVPSSVDRIQQVEAGSPHGIFTVGDVYSIAGDPDGWDETLFANLWHVTDRDVASVYTVLPLEGLVERLCVDLRGATCPEALDELFERSPDGSRLVDDMHLNTVIVVRESADGLPRVPEGWTLDTSGEATWVLRRDDPVPPAGGVTRTEGAEVTVLDQSDTEVSFRVDEVQTDDATVVLSRMAWPGYRIDGATEADPAQDFLLTVAVGPETEGEVVTVQFRPPGWTIELVAGVGALVLALVWSVADVVRRRRARVTT